MKLTPHLQKLILFVAAIALSAWPTLADPAKTLEDAGLTKTGVEYIFKEETEILRAQRDISQAQRDLKEAEDDFRDAERKIGKAQNYIAALQREIDELRSQARRADTRNKYDRAVSAMEQKVREIEQTQEERKKFEVEQQAKIDDARADYIETMFTWVDKAQTITKKYEAIADDPAITEAIKQVSEQDNRRYALGPSKRFIALQKKLAKASEEYQRGAVDLRKEHNTLMIDVRINSKPIREMILDTGASSVSLPFLFAKDLGIVPTENDPVVQLQMADGKIVDARQVKLDSVQVGEFIVKNVEAFVLPEHLHAAPPLLGNSFLGNFTFEVDPDRGKLILSRLKDGEKE